MKKPAKKKPTEIAMPASKPADWHRRIAQVTGQLSMAVVRRSMTKGQLEGWRNELREVGEEMNATLGGGDASSARPRQ
jgi:hypothetical protein